MSDTVFLEILEHEVKYRARKEVAIFLGLAACNHDPSTLSSKCISSREEIMQMKLPEEAVNLKRLSIMQNIVDLICRER